MKIQLKAVGSGLNSNSTSNGFEGFYRNVSIVGGLNAAGRFRHTSDRKSKKLHKIKELDRN